MKRKSVLATLLCLAVVTCIAGLVVATSRADVSPTWTSQTLDPTGFLWDVAFGDADHAVAVFDGGAGGGSILLSGDGGATWTPHAVAERLFGVAFPDASHAWAVGANGTILASTDGGQTWLPQTSNTTGLLNSVSFVDAMHGWACVEGGSKLVATDDGGATWVPLDGPPLSEALNHGRTQICFVDEDHGWMPSAYEGLWATDDGGATWVKQGGDAPAVVGAVEFVDAMHGWCIEGEIGGSLYGTADGGVTWDLLDGLAASPMCISATDPLRLWAADRSSVYASDNGGDSWVRQSTDTSYDIPFWGMSIFGEHGLIVGASGQLLRSDHTGYADMRAPVTATVATPGQLWNPVPVAVDFIATDNKAVTATYFRVDDDAWQQGTSVVVPAPGDHTNDGLHRIWTYSVDAYGNEEAAHELLVGIDTQVPVTTLTPADKRHLDHWCNETSWVTIDASDQGGSLLQETLVDLNDAGFQPWELGTTIETRALADHSNDGVHTINVYSVDGAGNKEVTQKHAVSIDTRLPVAGAPYAASCRYHDYATLKFKIVDRRPCASLGSTTIKIYTLSGIRKLTLRPVKLFKKNVVQSYRFHCKLAKKKYFFVVTVEDGARNFSRRPAVNYLTVR